MMDPGALRARFVELMTVDGTTRDARRRDFNQAIFFASDGEPVWSGTDMGMVLEKFDRAVKDLTPKRSKASPS